MAVVNELITKFSYQGSTAPIKDFNTGLAGSIKLLGVIGTASIAASAAIAKFAQSTLSSLDPLIQLSRRTRVAVGDLQELGFVASVTGSDARSLESSIEGLADKIGEAAQRGSEDFSRLGISVRDMNGQVKSADSVLLEVGKRFRELNLSAEEQQNFAQKLGIDRSLVQLLRLSGSEMDRLRGKARSLGIITKQDADAAASFNDSLTTLRFGLAAIKNNLAIGLAPEMELMSERFTDFLTDNKELIQKGLRVAVTIVNDLSASFIRLAPVLGIITAGFLLWKLQAIGLAGILSFIGSPIILITAGIAALLLVVDDLIVAFQGGKSVIADFFESFFGVDIRPALQAMVGWVEGFVDSIIFVFENGFSGLWQLVLRDINMLADQFVSLFTDAFKTVTSFGSDVFSGIGEFFGLSPGVGAPSSQSTTNNNSVSQQIQIDVRSDDPQAAGQSVRDNLQNQLSDAKTQFSVGGM